MSIPQPLLNFQQKPFAKRLVSYMLSQISSKSNLLTKVAFRHRKFAQQSPRTLPPGVDQNSTRLFDIYATECARRYCLPLNLVKGTANHFREGVANLSLRFSSSYSGKAYSFHVILRRIWYVSKYHFR